MPSAALHKPVAPPATAAERWLHCSGLKNLLAGALRFHLHFRGRLSHLDRRAFRVAVELPDPCTLGTGWAGLAIRFDYRPRHGGRGSGAPPPRPLDVPHTLPLYARAFETATGGVAAQWFVFVPQHWVIVAEPMTGTVLPSTDPLHVQLTCDSLTAFLGGDPAETGAIGAAGGPPPPAIGAATRRRTLGTCCHNETPIPLVRPGGHWLEELGEGSRLDVITGPGCILLDLPPQARAQLPAGTKP